MSNPIATALHNILADPYYLGSEGIASHVKWTASPDGQTEILIAAGNSDAELPELSPVILTLVGQIRSDRNYLTIDGVYNPDRPMSWQVSHSVAENLIAGMASCLVGAAPASIPQANAAWLPQVENAEHIMRDVLPMVNKSGFFTREDGRVVLKFVHKPFDAREPDNILPKPTPTAAPGKASTDSSDTNNITTPAGSTPNVTTSGVVYSAEHLAALEALDSDREPEFRTVNIPAHPRNREAILDLAHTHMFNPLCAFMHGTRDVPITPAQYGTVLPGAVARISFTLSHRLMRRPTNVSHFTATIDEIEVLHRPVNVSMTPSKALNQKMFLKRRRNDEPSTNRDLRKRTRN
ncbi:hypothetical protein FRC11_001063 [Ceratobasidium sp. 423]|nr:hypothetical protein FRC11_001063 [Ceratobasidium sp. 423]